MFTYLSKASRLAIRGHGKAFVKSFSASSGSYGGTSDLSVADRLSMKGKTVLVTGGGRGIGFAVCKSVAQMGANVAIIDALERPVDEFSELEERFGSKTMYQQADVTKQDSLEAAFHKVVDNLGEIHGCVPAAGIAIDKPFFDHQWEECQRVLAVNTLGTFWTAKLASQHMAQHKKGGSIVMIASIAAQGVRVPLQNISIYNMSKAAVKGLAGPLAVEMGPHKIRVNTISPGIILSPMTSALRTQYPKLLNMFEHAAPADRIGVPEVS